jgi:exonuclease V gamma subunit
MSDANKTQVAGNHYSSSIQHWDFVYERLEGRYLEGNITKYLTRYRKKNGLQDLEKARHYLMKLMELYTKGSVRPLYRFHPSRMLSIEAYAAANELTEDEANVIDILANWSNSEHLMTVGQHITRMIAIERDRIAQMDEGDPAEPDGSYVDQG